MMGLLRATAAGYAVTAVAIERLSLGFEVGFSAITGIARHLSPCVFGLTIEP